MEYEMHPKEFTFAQHRGYMDAVNKHPMNSNPYENASIHATSDRMADYYRRKAVEWDQGWNYWYDEQQQAPDQQAGDQEE